MKKVIRTLTKLITGNELSSLPKTSFSAFRKLTARDLIRRESAIGGTLFGPVAPGHRREFFCLDEHTWVWYEEWIDIATNTHKSTTTRYEIHPNGVLKVQDGQPYTILEGQELRNLAQAIKLYREQVLSTIYGRDPQSLQAAGTI